MKKLIFPLICGLLFFLMINTAMAQIVLPEVNITGKTNNIPAKVDKAFKSTFKDAEDPEWYQASRNYLVKFISKDMRNSALFQKNGALIYNISYGTAKDLPSDIHKMVESTYKDYNVLVAINVRQDQRNIWLLNLDNNKRLITARVEEGTINEVSNMKKLR